MRDDQVVPDSVEDLEQVAMGALVLRLLLTAVLRAGATEIDSAARILRVVVPAEKPPPAEIQCFGDDDRQAHPRQFGGLLPQVGDRLEEVDEDTGPAVRVLLVVRNLKKPLAQRTAFVRQLVHVPVAGSENTGRAEEVETPQAVEGSLAQGVLGVVVQCEPVELGDGPLSGTLIPLIDEGLEEERGGVSRAPRLGRLERAEHRRLLAGADDDDGRRALRPERKSDLGFDGPHDRGRRDVLAVIVSPVVAQVDEDGSMPLPSRVHPGGEGCRGFIEGRLLGTRVGGVQEEELGRESPRAVEHGAGDRSADLLVRFPAEDPLGDVHAARCADTARNDEEHCSSAGSRKPVRKTRSDLIEGEHLRHL